MESERIRDFELALTAAIPELPRTPEGPFVRRLADTARAAQTEATEALRH